MTLFSFRGNRQSVIVPRRHHCRLLYCQPARPAIPRGQLSRGVLGGPHESAWSA